MLSLQEREGERGAELRVRTQVRINRVMGGMNSSSNLQKMHAFCRCGPMLKRSRTIRVSSTLVLSLEFRKISVKYSVKTNGM